MADVLLLVLGLGALWAGTELTLSGALDLTQRLGLSQGFVGLAVLAIGTDLPELVVAVSGGLAQLRGVESSGVVVGNAVGSALTQGTLVLGVAGVLRSLELTPRALRRDGFALFASAALLWLLAVDGRVTRLEGALLIAGYAAYLAILARSEQLGSKLRGGAGAGRLRLAVFLVGGLALVAVGADLVVTHAVALASTYGVDSTLIGLFLVGAGTSLPELALSLGAAAKGRIGLSVGNVIGSNLFDLLVPVGASAAIHPLRVEWETLYVDLPFFALATALTLFLFVRTRGLQRVEAVGLIALYLSFAVLRITVFA